MKRILLSTVALGVLGLGKPAMGADLPVKAEPLVARVYDWTGIWFGGFGGYGFGNHNLNQGTTINPINGFNPFLANWESHGPIGGAEIGYYWQTGQFVWGIAGDGAGTNIQGTDNNAAGQAAIAPQIDSNKLKWVASLTVQGGVAVDRLLLYFKGGWAVGYVDHTDINPGVGTESFTNHLSGLTAGGGLAFAATDNIIAKIEYRYYDLGTYHRFAPTNGVTPYQVSNTFSVVTLGVDFKFGAGTVVAKY
jgi:outer membrane immunogenic protein